MKKEPTTFIRLTAMFCAVLGLAQMLRPSQDFYVPSDPPSAQYTIDSKIEVSDKAVTISGEGFIVFKSTFSRPLSVIAIDWRIDTGNSLEISAQEKTLPMMNVKKGLAASTPLFYELPTAVEPGAVLKLKIRFSGRFEANTASPLTLQRWYPSLWWEGIPTRDSFKVKITNLPGYVMAISGRLNKNSGYYENDGVTTTFGIYLAQGMRAEQREVEDVLITVLFTKDGEECARLCLNTAADIIKFDKEWLGFYPFKSLTIIPGASRPMGGYPFASAIVVIHGQEKFKEMPLLHWKWIMAHEIGHQYWGEYVMSDDYPYDYTSSWVHIGLGICTDRKWTVSRNLGLDMHMAFLNRYLDGVKKRYDTTEDAPPSLLKTQRYDLNNVVIHGKGFSILSALESVEGKDTFERILKQCLKEYGGKRMGWRDFRKVCERETGENLNWFFEPWVRSNKYLCYQIKSRESTKENGKYVTKIMVESAFDSIRMPVPVEAVFDDGSTQVKTTDRLAQTSILQFESPAKLKKAGLNPDHNLAMLEEPLPVLPVDIPERIEKLPWTGAGKGSLEIFELPETQKISDTGLWLKLGMTLFDGGYYKESLEAFKKITQLNPDKELNFVALVWMGHNEDLLNERERAIADYTEALKYDTGMSMRHDQYRMTIDRHWVEERLKTPFKRATN